MRVRKALRLFEQASRWPAGNPHTGWLSFAAASIASCSVHWQSRTTTQEVKSLECDLNMTVPEPAPVITTSYLVVELRQIGPRSIANGCAASVQHAGHTGTTSTKAPEHKQCHRSAAATALHYGGLSCCLSGSPSLISERCKAVYASAIRHVLTDSTHPHNESQTCISVAQECLGVSLTHTSGVGACA